MDKLSRLLDLARTKPLSDIVLPGYSSDDPPAPRYFAPRLTRIYLDFEGSLVKFSSDGNSSTIVIDFPDCVERDFDIDEDDEFTVSSIADMVLSVPYTENHITRVEAFFLVDNSPEDGVLAAVGLWLAQGDFLFFDPSNFWGIRVGGTALRDSWLSKSMIPGFEYRVAGWDVSAANQSPT